jgi:hypothetical protein
MSFFKVIKEWLGNIKHGKKLYFFVESIDPGILKDYHNDSHWYLEENYGQGKFPATIIFIGMEGKSQDKIFVYYDDRETDKTEIEKVLLEFGIHVKK